MKKTLYLLRLLPYLGIVFLSGCIHPDAEVKATLEPRLEAFAAKFTGQTQIDKPAVFALLREYLQQNPDIFGAAFAYAPVNANGSTLLSSPYVFRTPDGLAEKDLAESYAYTEEAWYSRPVELARSVWSDPYFDEGGGDVWMITYSVPVYDTEGSLLGVVTSDLPADQ